MKKFVFPSLLLVVAVFLIGCASQDEPMSPTASSLSTGSIQGASGSGSGNNRIKLEANLVATPAGQLASGKAKFEDRGNRRKFSTEVEDVAAAGNYKVRVAGSFIGTVVVNANGFGDLNLDTANGNTVPKLKAITL